MKYLRLVVVLLFAVACRKEYAEFYMAYDVVEMREEPFDDSPVVARVSTLPQPGNFRYNPAKPQFYVSIGGAGTPLIVQEKDDTGKWGFVEVNDLNHACKGWVRLSRLTYTGSTAQAEEVVPAYVVKGPKATLYKHPRAAASEAFPYWVVKGDTLRVWDTSGSGWVHVSRYRMHDAPPYEYRLGWVQVSELSAIEPFSNKTLEEKKAREAVITQNYIDQEVLDRYGISAKLFYQLLFGGGAFLALFVALILTPSAIKRKKVLRMWIGLAFCAVVLGWRAAAVTMYIPRGFSMLIYPFFRAVVAICYAFVLVYPLLYIRLLARIWKYLFFAAVFYPAMLVIAPQKNVIMVVALLVFAGVVVLFLGRKLQNDVCPYCGYFAANDILGSHHTSQETSSEGWRESTYEGGVLTRASDYIITHITSTYTTQRRCMRCGREYENVEVIRSERKRFV